MRSDRFTSIAAVIALLATVQVANVAADDGLLSTLTLTRTVYNKPTAVPLQTNAPVSDIKKSRDQNSHKQHTTISHPREATEFITHHITEIHHATQAPSNVAPSVKPMPINSASSVVIVSASPTAVNSVMPSQVNNGEEVIIKTKTKKNKTKLKTKTINKKTTAMHPVTQSAPMSASPVHTAPAAVVSISQQPSRGAPSLVSKSGPSSSMMLPSASGSAALPMGTSSLLSGSIPPAASSADAVPGMVSTSAVSQQQPTSAMPAVIVVAAPSPQAPSSAPPAPKQSPSIDSVNNNANKKINPPAASANPANGAPSDRSVGPALFLAWLMAAVAAF